jgi:hypothetical protein
MPTRNTIPSDTNQEAQMETVEATQWALDRALGMREYINGLITETDDYRRVFQCRRLVKCWEGRIVSIRSAMIILDSL